MGSSLRDHGRTGGCCHDRQRSLTWIVLGLFVIAGAVGFIALGSRRMRMTAGALVLIAAGAGLVIALVDPNSSGAAWGAGGGPGRRLWDRGPAPFRWEGPRDPRGEALADRPAEATPSGDLAMSHKRRVSDASLLALSVVAIVIALGVVFFLAIWGMCSDPTEWC
jgi:hypothetical protein